MASKIEIINRALLLIGASTITSLNDPSQEAIVVSQMYEQTLRSLLSETRWGFSVKRTRLTQVVKTAEWSNDNMNNYFKLPSDLITIVDVENKGTVWRVEEENIICNASSFGLLYVFYNDDTSKYPSYFVDAFATKLAYDVCYNLTNSTTMTDMCYKLAEKKLLEAKSKDVKQGGTPSPIDNYKFTNARYGANVW